MSEESPERIVHTFSSQERYVLINLAEQILELLGQSSVSRDPLHDIVGISGNELPPDDPVLKRLLPSAYRELQDAAEFRRYTEDSLRNKKREHARRIREMLLDDQSDVNAKERDRAGESGTETVFVHGDNEVEMSSIPLTITGEDCWAWLSGLNDIRLALAVRLDIGGTSMGDLPNDQHRSNGPFELTKENDPMKAVFAVYSWLGWLQEDFLHQLDGEESSNEDTNLEGEPPLPNP